MGDEGEEAAIKNYKQTHTQNHSRLSGSLLCISALSFLCFKLETLKRAGFSNTQVRATVNLFQCLEEPYETFAYWLKHGPNEYRRIVNMSLPPMQQILQQTHAQLLKIMYP